MAEDVLEPEAEAPKKKAPKKAEVCGHLNKHYRGDGKLTCELPAGHSGDHEADYEVLRDGKMVDDRAYWSDAVDL